MHITTRKLAYMALLIALTVIFRAYSFQPSVGGVAIIKIGFGNLSIIFAGILLGPAAGALVGALGDIVSFLIAPMGPYMPHFTVTAALTGLVPALVLKAAHKGDGLPGFVKLAVAIGVSQLLVEVLIEPVFLWNLFAIPLQVTLPTRLVSELAINVPLFSYLIVILNKALSATSWGYAAIRDMK